MLIAPKYPSSGYIDIGSISHAIYLRREGVCRSVESPRAAGVKTDLNRLVDKAIRPLHRAVVVHEKAVNPVSAGNQLKCVLIRPRTARVAMCRHLMPRDLFVRNKETLTAETPSLKDKYTDHISPRRPVVDKRRVGSADVAGESAECVQVSDRPMKHFAERVGVDVGPEGRDDGLVVGGKFARVGIERELVALVFYKLTDAVDADEEICESGAEEWEQDRYVDFDLVVVVLS